MLNESLEITLERVRRSSLSGQAPDMADLIFLLDEPAAGEGLMRAADEVRLRRCGKGADLCSIVNARCGRCSENCAFCAQSAHHLAEITAYPLLRPEEILNAARRAAADGAHRFSIVTSGATPDPGDFESLLAAVNLVSRHAGLKCCASLGELSRDQLVELKSAGLSRYHHNVETAEGYFTSICTTHSYRDRLRTIEAVREAGLEICCGGIWNLGETDRQRLEMAYELRDLQPASVPLNFLDPRPGTPLAGQPPLREETILRYIAAFRLVLPDTNIRLAGGRAALGQSQAEAFRAGANGLMIGDYLTTAGSPVAEDLSMLRGLGFNF